MCRRDINGILDFMDVLRHPQMLADGCNREKEYIGGHLARPTQPEVRLHKPFERDHW